MNNWITGTLLATVVAGAVTEAATGKLAERELRHSIEVFRNAGDERDLGAIDSILHKDFRLFAYFGDATNAATMDKAAYTGALRAGKIGGKPRTLKIVSIDVRGSHAACRISMESTELKFDNYMHWVKTERGWQLLNDLTHAVPK
ncbi:MAG: nuclear transport factor 2 family protein [Turneriella sp.]